MILWAENDGDFNIYMKIGVELNLNIAFGSKIEHMNMSVKWVNSKGT